MNSKELAKCIFGLVYRLVALWSLVWGLYQLVGVSYGVVSLMADESLGYTFCHAFVSCFPSMIQDGIFVFCGLVALHFSPKILAFLYREE